MTDKYKEAIQAIKSNYPPSNYTTLRDGLDLAIKALEKQIPQKPREHYHWGDFTKEEKLENNQWFCGKCSNKTEWR